MGDSQQYSNAQSLSGDHSKPSAEMNDEVEGKRSTYSNKRQAPPPPPPSAKFPDKAQALTSKCFSEGFSLRGSLSGF